MIQHEWLIVPTLYITGALAFGNAYFGEGSGSVLLSTMYCTGYEDNLLDCSFSTYISYYYCEGHEDDAGVRCPGIVSVWHINLYRIITKYVVAREQAWLHGYIHNVIYQMFSAVIVTKC